jgi:hypothetical protein
MSKYINKKERKLHEPFNQALGWLEKYADRIHIDCMVIERFLLTQSKYFKSHLQKCAHRLGEFCEFYTRLPIFSS